MNIIDTNVLMSHPNIITKEKDIIIPTDVLKELDGLKSNINSEVAFQARRAAIVISKHMNSLKFNDDLEDTNLKVDDKLIELSRKLNGTLITNDVYLKIKALIEGVKTKGYGGTEDYSGVYYWTTTFSEDGYNRELELMLQTGKPIMDLRQNQYLVVNNQKGENIAIYRYTGSDFVQITKRNVIVNKWYGKIVARNIEQMCLMDALADKDLTVVYAGGAYGTGKSLLTNNYALQELEKNNIRKIIYIPNNAYVANSMEIGMLPGDSLDKTLPLVGPLLDFLGIDEINRMISSEQLEIIPMAYLRGRNFEDSIVIVNEAQNLDSDHVKLLLGRIGNNSRIFFDGSTHQIDSDIFKNKNGLKTLLNVSESPYKDLFATVELKSIERSRTARIADYLDSIDGTSVNS